MSAQEREGESQKHVQTARNSGIVRIMGLKRKDRQGQCMDVNREAYANASSRL